MLELFLFNLQQQLHELECSYQEALLRVHTAIAIGKAFFNVGRGEVVTDGDTDDIRDMMQSKWSRYMNVKKETFEETITNTESAHGEFFDFTFDVVKDLKNAARENAPVPTSLLNEWWETLVHFVTKHTTHHADFHEVGMLRCFEVLHNMMGLAIVPQKREKNFHTNDCFSSQEHLLKWMS